VLSGTVAFSVSFVVFVTTSRIAVVVEVTSLEVLVVLEVDVSDE
jgi:hypothetical protein